MFNPPIKDTATGGVANCKKGRGGLNLNATLLIDRPPMPSQQ